MPRGRPKKKVTEPSKLIDKVDEQNDVPKCQNGTLDNANDTLDNPTENNTESTKGRKSSNSKQYPLCTRCGNPIKNYTI